MLALPVVLTMLALQAVLIMLAIKALLTILPLCCYKMEVQCCHYAGSLQLDIIYTNHTWLTVLLKLYIAFLLKLNPKYLIKTQFCYPCTCITFVTLLYTYC